MRFARMELALAFLVSLGGALVAFLTQRAMIGLLLLIIAALLALYWATLARRT